MDFLMVDIDDAPLKTSTYREGPGRVQNALPYILFLFSLLREKNT